MGIEGGSRGSRVRSRDLGSGLVRAAEEKEPLIQAAFGPQISADHRNNVSANGRFLLRVKVPHGKLNHFRDF